MANVRREFQKVTLLLTKSGHPIAVYAEEAAATAVRNRFNDYPNLDGGDPDPDAPYTTETWSVTKLSERREV